MAKRCCMDDVAIRCGEDDVAMDDMAKMIVARRYGRCGKDDVARRCGKTMLQDDVARGCGMDDVAKTMWQGRYGKTMLYGR